jgi:hypothetical protein
VDDDYKQRRAGILAELKAVQRFIELLK